MDMMLIRNRLEDQDHDGKQEKPGFSGRVPRMLSTTGTTSTQTTSCDRQR